MQLHALKPLRVTGSVLSTQQHELSLSNILCLVMLKVELTLLVQSQEKTIYPLTTTSLQRQPKTLLFPDWSCWHRGTGGGGGGGGLATQHEQLRLLELLAMV